MASGAMGMAVNHDGCAGLPEEIGDDGGVDVHDVGRFALIGFFAFLTVAGNDLSSFGQRESQKQEAHDRVMGAFPEAHVVDVIRTLRIAMRQHELFVAEFDDRQIGKCFCADGSQEFSAGQQVPIAGNPENGCAPV